MVKQHPSRGANFDLGIFLGECMLNQSTLLPDSSFVRFEGRRVKNPIAVWKNYDLEGDIDISNIFCMPYLGEPDSTYGPQTSDLLGERYGGIGVGSNGGGVRCGIHNGVQIKGVGKNPLAGAEAHFWHSHGGCAIELAYREAIWGEVCNIALPYGAARVHAIVETGTRIPYLAHDGKRDTRRALVFRQMKIRPAHFMRAIGFVPGDSFKKENVSDAFRTREGILKLPAVMFELFGEADPKKKSFHALFSALIRRQAKQIAAARSRKLLHGGLCASNIAIDGSWLDFDTITSISDYGRIIMGSFDIADFWTDHKDILAVIHDLWSYVKKYAPPCQSDDLDGVNVYTDFFVSELEIAHAVEFAKLTGIPIRTIENMDRAIVFDLYRVVRQIVRKGNESPFYFSPRHVWEMPIKTGEYSLAEVFRVSSLCQQPRDLVVRLSKEIIDEDLRTRFVRSYWRMREIYNREFGGGLPLSAQIFLALNCRRVNSCIPALFRREMDFEIEKYCAAECDLSGFVSSLVARAKFNLSPDIDGVLSLEFFGNKNARLDHRNGFFVGEEGLSVVDFLVLTEDFFSPEEIETIKGFV